MFRRGERQQGQRLNIFVCYCSSQDPDHPVASLQKLSTRSRGWHSQKNCPFPQELILRFEGEVDLDILRILVHEAKIPSRIEIFIASATDDVRRSGIMPPPLQCTFKRLGHVNLQSNEESQFTARELKGIVIRQNCIYVKLVLRKPHKNDLNVFQQASIVGMEAYGKLVRPFRGAAENPADVQIAEEGDISLDEMVPFSPLSTPAPATAPEAVNGIDGETAREIKKLEELKARAIGSEDYDLAKVLKERIARKWEVGKLILQLEVQKLAAVKEENFDAAQQLKRQIDFLRRADEGQAQVQLPAIPPPLRGSSAGPVSGSTTHNACSAVSSIVPLPNAVADTPSASLSLSLLRLHGMQSGSEPASRGAGLQPSDGYDEIPVAGRGEYIIDESSSPFGPSVSIPAGTVHQGDGDRDLSRTLAPETEWERALASVINREGGEGLAPESLPPKKAAEAKTVLRDLGMYCGSCLFARRTQLREAAIKALVSVNGYNAVSGQCSGALACLLGYFDTKGYGFSDPVVSVVIATCDALEVILKEQLPGVPALSSLMPLLERLLPGIISKLGDGNSRVRERVLALLNVVAEKAGHDTVINGVLADSSRLAGKHAGQWHLLSRLQLMIDFVTTLGVSSKRNTSGIPVDPVARHLVIPGLTHPNGEIRESAINLYCSLYTMDERAMAPLWDLVNLPQRRRIHDQVKQVNGVGVDSTLDARGGEHPALAAAAQAPPAPATTAGSAAPRAPATQNGKGERTPRSKGKEVAKPSCQFCGVDENVLLDDTMDAHYLSSCPMLCSCPNCEQLTEICTLQRHLIEECVRRREVRACPRCKEAIPVESYGPHVAAASCIQAREKVALCPLCHATFRDTVSSWRKHLATAPGCPSNNRSYDGSGAL